MFFENPIDAFANIKLSMKTNGSLNFVCWSNMKENDFFFEGLEMIAKCTKQNLPPITKNPGPFAFSENEYIENITVENLLNTISRIISDNFINLKFNLFLVYI